MFAIQCACGHQDIVEAAGYYSCEKCGASVAAKFVVHDLVSGIVGTVTYDVTPTEVCENDSETKTK